MRRPSARRRLLTAPLLLFLAVGAGPAGAPESPLLGVMKAELDRTMRDSPPDSTAPRITFPTPSPTPGASSSRPRTG